MRALQHTGWLNFRMRAMLVSFAAYPLWLHWYEPAQHLARLFTDYETGIHYSKMQMQSGTTGINTMRVYHPIKQGQEHDPAGIFIRRWVPELQGLQGDFIHTPWLAPPILLAQEGVVLVAIIRNRLLILRAQCRRLRREWRRCIMRLDLAPRLMRFKTRMGVGKAG